MTVESDLVNRMSALVGKRDLAQTEFAAWFGGAANGGPNGDGMFPLTDSTGYTRLVPSPDKQMAQVADGGGFNLTGFNALPQATKAQVKASSPQVVGVTSDGTLRRFTTDLFASRKTEDLDVLPGSKFAEYLSCLGNDGEYYKVSSGSLIKAVGGVIDPSLAPYNVQFTAKKFRGITYFENANVVWTEHTDARFSQDDLGKMCFVSNYDWNNGGSPVTYIGGVNSDGTNAYLFHDQACTVPYNAVHTATYNELVFGFDGTAGMQKALDDAEPQGYEDRGRCVVVGGFALVRRLRFGNVSIVGLSPTNTGFFQWGMSGDGGYGDPWIGPKGGGDVGHYGDHQRPHHYSLLNLTLQAQGYTTPYGFHNYRNALQIFGGGFGDVYQGAAYARIEGIDIYESPYKGFFGDGVFAGLLKDLRAFQCFDVGLHIGFYDLNGENWHAEGNVKAGIYSTMAGANVFGVRCSFNGAGGDYSGTPDEDGSNYVEAGFGNTVTNLRLQESWSHSLCITDVDTAGFRGGGGRNNAFYLGTFDDTADVSSMTVADGSLQRGAHNLPNMRSMIHFRKTGDIYNSAEGPRFNTIKLMTGSYQVRQTNYATNAISIEGYCRDNQVDIRTPNITNNPNDYMGSYPGLTEPYSRGPWAIKNSDGNSIAALGNVITVNGQTAP